MCITTASRSEVLIYKVHRRLHILPGRDVSALAAAGGGRARERHEWIRSNLHGGRRAAGGGRARARAHQSLLRITRSALLKFPTDLVESFKQ
ncbi:hypothetical protein EVAR_31751_1 [Eumeta japonica]|uniref:Uncharacterized protein n=1 Tax=Eumeta variegata TaxID=151549 RepID=A0A4C1W2W3_EUMVA|nr:hypothetical protein EVAR_31751_1 [Eumeta japonica]